jgi:hypothetical protein
VTEQAPGSERPQPQAVRAAAGRLTAQVAAHLPRNVAPGGAPWDFYGPAMVSRMVDTVESVMALMEADRAVDGAVLVRVLYEHVVKFCWISIDPVANYERWQSDSVRWDIKFHNDAVQIGVVDGESSTAQGLQALPDVGQLAAAVDQYWPDQISAFTSPNGGPVLVTFRGLYLIAYRNASEAVHGRPRVLNAYGSLGSEVWSMGPDAAFNSLLWPLTVPLFAQALLVCHEQWGWPDPDLVIAANNAMYGL